MTEHQNRLEFRLSYPILLDLLVKVVNVGLPDRLPEHESWRYGAQDIAVKFLGHLASLRVLLNPIPIEVSDKSASPLMLVDMSSVQVIGRAVVETFLVFKFIFVNDDPTLSEFRQAAWQLGGCMDRTSIVPTEDAPPLVHARIASAREQIASLIPYLRSSSHLEAYTPKQQLQLLRGDWRINNSWPDLANNADLDPVHFSNTYKHLCGHAHTSWIGAIQAKQSFGNLPEQLRLVEGIGQLAMMMTSHFIFRWVEAHPASEQILAQESRSTAHARKWYFRKESFESLFTKPDKS